MFQNQKLEGLFYQKINLLMSFVQSQVARADVVGRFTVWNLIQIFTCAGMKNLKPESVVTFFIHQI